MFEFFIAITILVLSLLGINWISIIRERLNSLESTLRWRTSEFEKALEELNKRLQNFEVSPKPVEPTPVKVPEAELRQSTKAKAENLVNVFSAAPQKRSPVWKPFRASRFSKSKTVRRVRRRRVQETPQPPTVQTAQITPVQEEVPFVAQLVQKSDSVSSQQELHDVKPRPAVTIPFVEKPAKAARKAYDLDEDHDMKPAFFTGEQSQLNYLELQIGRKVLGWVASLAMILTAVFLINYTAQRFTFAPIYRVIGLFAFGMAMLGGGFRYYLIGWKRFSRMLTSTGILILFLTGYATYGYYQLLSNTPAFLLMTVIVIGAFLLAYAYRSVLIGVHAIVGGLAVPLLIHGSPEAYPQLFAYLFLLNLGTVLLLNTLNRLPIGLLAILGTQAEFFAWYLSVGSVHWNGREFLFHLGDSTAVWFAFVFQAAFYFLYLIDTSFGTISKRFRTTWDDTVRAIIAPMLAFGWVYILFHQDGVLAGYMGVFAFIGAVWYALIHQVYRGCTSNSSRARSAVQ